jgi:hypothetical protein
MLGTWPIELFIVGAKEGTHVLRFHECAVDQRGLQLLDVAAHHLTATTSTTARRVGLDWDLDLRLRGHE